MNTVVYYPHIWPTPAWLKLAALCWDEVYTMTPRTAPHTPSAIRELDEALGGVITPVLIEPIARDVQITKQFENWLDARTEKLKEEQWSSERPEEQESLFSMLPAKFSGGELVRILEKHNLAKIENQKLYVQIPKWEEADWAQRSSETPYTPSKPKRFSDHQKYESLLEKARGKLFNDDQQGYEKLKGEADKIKQRNLITVEDWSTKIYLPKDVALFFLSLCASKAALDGKRDLAADGEQFTDIVFHSVESVRGEVATSVLQAYLPENLNTLDSERVAEFREEFATKRLKYQGAIQSLVNEFSNVASEQQLGRLKDNFLEIATERVEETRQVYQRANLGTAIKAFGLSLTPPAIATSIASALGIGIFAPAGIAAALSIFAAASMIEWNRAKAEREKNAWSYVLDAAKIQ